MDLDYDSVLFLGYGMAARARTKSSVSMSSGQKSVNTTRVFFWHVCCGRLLSSSQRAQMPLDSRLGEDLP